MNINTPFIIKKILKHNPSHLIIGFSGGIDSSVLLNLCKQLTVPTVAIYINHNIHRNANDWENHCKNRCHNLNIKFISHRLGKATKGKSFEAWASQQRMIFFQSQMAKYSNPMLILGHHKDDQAETFLLQTIRGSGLAGLAGIPEYKKLEFGFVIRPLLDFTKADIEAYAKQQKINYIYDDSNEDIKYRRNLIRNQILPILRNINPSISETLSRSANICAKSNNILNTLLDKELENIMNENSDISINKLTNLNQELQQSLLHLWFKKTSSVSLKSKQLKAITYSLNNKNPSTGWQININKNYNIVLEYGLFKIHYYDKDYKNKIVQKYIIEWLNKKFNKTININTIIIRDRLGSDRCRYIGRDKSAKLKILFQELQIPINGRKNIKVIELNYKIVAVYPFFICA